MAGSPNAFANMAIPPARQLSVLREQDHNARPSKRVRLSEVAVAAIHTQCADEETALEVDHMILDYLAHQTIKACLANRNPSAQDDTPLSLSHNLAMSDSFMSIFRARHPTFTPDPELRLRSLLLKLTTLFTQRLTSNPTTPSYSALTEWRKLNWTRAVRWRSAKSQNPATCPAPTIHIDIDVADAELERNRAHVLHVLGVEDHTDAHYGTMSSVSLLDLLPLFMQVSAARNAMSSSNMTETWMHLAGEFMLQACLERYLVFGTTRGEHEAFSWGYLEGKPSMKGAIGYGMTDESLSEINAMFEDEEYEIEVEGWHDVKTSYLSKLLAPSDENVVSHLEALADTYPIAAFEVSILKILEAILNSIPEPVLMQLEKGKLDGMTRQETKEFLDDCGLGVARFYEAPAGFKTSYS